ncbi:MAG TPA: hypothetical protein DHW39_00120 [Erysipelotrichaceae bacterium]|nr:hypothetical protein [Erysipelotrichaceae bacterium]
MILATVASLTQNGGATFLIDGEAEPTTKKYTSGSFNLNVGDRVLLEEVGDSYTVISKPGTVLSFDSPYAGERNRYIQLKPNRCYLLVETCWNMYNGERYSVSTVKASLFATAGENSTSSSAELVVNIAGSSSPFSRADNHQVYYSASYGDAHVTVMEL